LRIYLKVRFMKTMKSWCGMAALLLFSAPAALQAAPDIRMATTTSTEASGLLAVILPQFEAKYGGKVRVVAVGSGAAMKIGESGDADVLLVHARALEDKFMAAGFGGERRDVMYNDFVLVGPARDAAALRGGRDALEAIKKIAASGAKFISRGDESGTHEMEKSYWKSAGIEPKGAWYVSTGQGMGPVLTMAGELNAYALTDRATYAAYRDRTGLQVLVEGDARMFNPYGVITINPQRYANLNHAGAQAFAAWITSAEGQAAVAAFKINGVQMFFPNARK
jgi:tungstate transport system substrate-binding protein